MWSVEVLDADPEAPKREKTVCVKIVAKVQPVPPHNGTGMPFNPVELEGLTALPYVVAEEGRRPRLAWSFRATGMKAPGKASPAAKSSERGPGGVTCTGRHRRVVRHPWGVGRRSSAGRSRRRIRQVEEMHGELNRLRASFADAPDEELIITLTSACRSSGCRRGPAGGDARRSARTA